MSPLPLSPDSHGLFTPLCFFCPQVEAAEDYATDAMLHELCKPDAESICPDVKDGEGKIQTCLVRCPIPPPPSSLPATGSVALFAPVPPCPGPEI